MSPACPDILNAAFSGSLHRRRVMSWGFSNCLKSEHFEQRLVLQNWELSDWAGAHLIYPKGNGRGKTGPRQSPADLPSHRHTHIRNSEVVALSEK